MYTIVLCSFHWYTRFKTLGSPFPAFLSIMSTHDPQWFRGFKIVCRNSALNSVRDATFFLWESAVLHIASCPEAQICAGNWVKKFGNILAMWGYLYKFGSEQIDASWTEPTIFAAVLPAPKPPRIPGCEALLKLNFPIEPIDLGWFLKPHSK